MKRAVFLAGVRRFLMVLGMLAGATAVGSALLGFLTGSDISRSIAIGFYLVGSGLLIGGFFVGNRGPARPKGDKPTPMFGSRFVRWANPEEVRETMNTSAVYLSLGFALILLGVAVDSV